MPQCSDDVRDINVRLGRIETDVAQLKTAFVLNDRGAEDYDGHRKDHYVRSESARATEKTMGELKSDATKTLLKIVLTAAAGVFALGIGPYLRGLLGLVN